MNFRTGLIQHLTYDLDFLFLHVRVHDEYDKQPDASQPEYDQDFEIALVPQYAVRTLVRPFSESLYNLMTITGFGDTEAVVTSIKSFLRHKIPGLDFSMTFSC